MGVAQSTVLVSVPSLSLMAIRSQSGTRFYTQDNTFLFLFQAMLERKRRILMSNISKIIENALRLGDTNKELEIEGRSIPVEIFSDMNDEKIKFLDLHEVHRDNFLEYLFSLDAHHKMLVLHHALSAYKEGNLETHLKECFEDTTINMYNPPSPVPSPPKISKTDPLDVAVNTITQQSAASLCATVRNLISTFSSNPIDMAEVLCAAKDFVENVQETELSNFKDEEESEEEFVILKIEKSKFEKLKKLLTLYSDSDSESELDSEELNSSSRSLYVFPPV